MRQKRKKGVNIKRQNTQSQGVNLSKKISFRKGRIQEPAYINVKITALYLMISIKVGIYCLITLKSAKVFNVC